MTQPKTPFLISLLVYTAILRMLPYLLMNCEIHTDMSVLYYPWNFNPLAAACLFGGAYLADRRLALLVPLATLFVSDLGIWALSGRADWAFSRITYVSFIGVTLMGFLLRNAVRSQGSRGAIGRAIALGLTFEVLFFAVSNFAVWFNSSSRTPVLYPFTTAGLVACYIAAIPFFAKSVIGTTAFTALLFSPLGVRASTEESSFEQGTLVPVRVK
ncbi:MAG: DUF6580 family putative transport protein [Planctomycetaceae bacterium]